MAYTHVNSDECFLYVLEYHSIEKLTAEVEAGSGRADGAFVSSKNSLVVYTVLRSDFRLNPGRDRNLSKAEEEFLEVLVLAVIEETECPSP